jgi:hypothetical protein
MLNHVLRLSCPPALPRVSILSVPAPEMNERVRTVLVKGVPTRSGAEAVQPLSSLFQCGETEPGPDPAGAGDASPVEEPDQHCIVEETTGMLLKFH